MIFILPHTLPLPHVVMHHIPKFLVSQRDNPQTFRPGSHGELIGAGGRWVVSFSKDSVGFMRGNTLIRWGGKNMGKRGGGGLEFKADQLRGMAL